MRFSWPPSDSAAELVSQSSKHLLTSSHCSILISACVESYPGFCNALKIQRSLDFQNNRIPTEFCHWLRLPVCLRCRLRWNCTGCSTPFCGAVPFLLVVGNELSRPRLWDSDHGYEAAIHGLETSLKKLKVPLQIDWKPWLFDYHSCRCCHLST